MNEFLENYSGLALTEEEFNESKRDEWYYEEIFAFKSDDAPQGDKNLIESINDIRNSWGYDFLKNVNFIPFYWMGNGDYLIINLHKYNSKTKEAPVEYFKHEVLHAYEGKKVDFSKRNGITEETGFNSFGEWLEQLVEDNFEVPLTKKDFVFEEFEEEKWPDMVEKVENEKPKKIEEETEKKSEKKDF